MQKRNKDMKTPIVVFDKELKKLHNYFLLFAYSFKLKIKKNK